MCPPFLTDRGFIHAHAYSLTVSQCLLYQFICYPHNSNHSSSMSNLLAKLTASTYTIEVAHQLFHVFFIDMNYLLNLLKPKITL